jgi:hypothetical protein
MRVRHPLTLENKCVEDRLVLWGKGDLEDGFDHCSTAGGILEKSLANGARHAREGLFAHYRKRLCDHKNTHLAEVATVNVEGFDRWEGILSIKGAGTG